MLMTREKRPASLILRLVRWLGLGCGTGDLDRFPKEDAIFHVRDHPHGLDLIHKRVWFDVDGGSERVAFLLFRRRVSQDRGENRQRGEALLAIYDLPDDLAGRLDEDDAAQKVRLAVARLHRLTEVLEQLQGMFWKPGIGTLVGWYLVDEGVAQDVGHGVLIGGNHLFPLPISSTYEYNFKFAVHPSEVCRCPDGQRPGIVYAAGNGRHRWTMN